MPHVLIKINNAHDYCICAGEGSWHFSAILLINKWRCGLLLMLLLLYSSVSYRCMNSFTNKDHDTAKKLLPNLQRYDITCKHPCYLYATYLVHCAAYNGWEDIIKELINTYKCDALQKDSEGWTPLQYAVHGGHLRIVQYLVQECGGNIYDRDDVGHTPLHHGARDGQLEIVRYLVGDCGSSISDSDNSGWTPLHHAAGYGCIDIVEYLVEERGDDVMAVTIDCGKPTGITPFHSACQNNIDNRNISVIKYLLSKPVVLNSFADKSSIYSSPLSGAEGDAATIYDKFESIRISHPVGSFVNIFLLGDTGAGKTSLCHVLKERASHHKETGGLIKRVKTKTAGIVSYKHFDEKLGNVIIHDFAGHSEYYSSHSAVIESMLQGSTAVFIIIINLTQDLPQQVRFWSNTVMNECQKAMSSECHLIVVASHADRVKFKFKKSQLVRALTEAGYTRKDLIFPLDCRLRSSDSLCSFVKALSQLCTSIRNEHSPDISLYCNFLFSTIEANSKASKNHVCTFENLTSLCDQARQHGVPLPVDIVPLLRTLHSKGLIVYLENKKDFAKSWIVVQKEVLLATVDGVLFAPLSFKEHSNIASNTGIIISRALESEFDLNIDMLIAFLKSMRLCEEVDKVLLEVTNLALKQEDYLDDSDKLLFFPALMAVDKPRKIIKKHFRIGWCLKVTKYSFSIRFLHVLLLHLAYQYSEAITSEHEPLVPRSRRCFMWKNGIHWHNDDGIETIVEQTEDNQCVKMLMSCKKGLDEDMIRLHCELMKTITDLQQKYCPKLDCKGYLIAPHDLQYSADKPATCTSCIMYDMNKLICRIRQKKEQISGDANESEPAIMIKDLVLIKPELYLKFYEVSY